MSLLTNLSKNDNLLKSIYWAFLIGCGLFGCKVDQTYNSKKVQKEVWDFLHDYQEAMNTEGLMSEFRFLDSTNAFYWVPPGYTSVLNFDSVRTILIATAPTLSQINNRWDYLNVYPLNDTLANYTGKLVMEHQDTSGNINQAELLETGLVVQRKNGWKILSGQSSVVQ